MNYYLSEVKEDFRMLFPFMLMGLSIFLAWFMLIR